MAAIFPSDMAIVVGGGLGGMSAANTVLEHNGKVVLLDKSSFCGGNSTKATSGINGAATKTQKDKGIPDTIELFTSDTLKGGAKKPELVKVLCGNSGADVDWLVEKFNLDLSLVARLGGHSAPRTHRGAERFPGMTITYALIQMVEKIAEKTDKARIVTKAKVHKLLTSNGACVGCVYEKGGVDFQEHGPVILATGGFGADFTNNSLLAQYRPDLMHLPTTNGEHCTGDGIKMGEAIGAKTIDLEWVQVHPTGLVKPDDPDAKIKFLAAEALRGVGGIVLDANGKRFANELGRRDYVTGEMWKNKPPFRLCLNKAASTEIHWHCKHYTGRGVMKFYETGEALAKDIGVPVSVLEETHEAHYHAAKKTEKDPEGGSWPAYPSGKSWDEASGKTGSGKKFYHNIIPGSAVKSEPFYVAIITPVIHYCMGGLEIDVDSAVVDSKTGKAIPGLYAAGEVAGGVHGNNRLGGNSLLDCVVFGRVSGLSACKYMLGNDMKPVDLKELSGGGLSGAVQASKLSGGSYEDSMNKSNAPGAAANPKMEKKEKSAGGGGGLTMAEVAKHTTKTDCWVVLHDRVLDVTSFLSQHPGGELAILTFAGKDATAEFDMIHPPDVIEKYAPDSVIGALGGAVDDEDDEDDDDDDDDDEEDEEVVGEGGYTADEVAKHTTKDDCWVILAGQVLNVTSFLSQHPGGELAILTFAGKDATAEFDMIHPPDVIGKYAPDAVIGALGGGGGGAKKVKKSGGGGGGAGGLTMEEVAKHTTKTDCWVVLHNRVLDVTSFLSQHPGGELAILTFAGKDATAEFDMIHPPDVIEKYAPDSVLGTLGAGGGGGGGKKKKGKKGVKPVITDKGDAIANHQAWGHLDGRDNWRDGRMDENPGVLLINVRAYFYAAWYLLSAVLYEVCATIFFNNNFKITGDRKGLTRSAILLVLFIVIHAVGNLHVFKGPDDFNGYGYFYVRLYWTGFGLPANIVEEYILLGILLHVLAGLKRTWDTSITLFKMGDRQALNLAFTGLILLTFMTIHLFQFRFGDTDQFGPYMVRPPPYLINFWGVFELNLFWTGDKSIEPVGVRDIYALEYKLFQDPWLCLFYIACVCVFMVHGCLGWKKLASSSGFGIPQKHVAKVNVYGYVIFIAIGLIYISFPLYCIFTAPFKGYEASIQQLGHSER